MYDQKHEKKMTQTQAEKIFLKYDVMEHPRDIFLDGFGSEDD